MTYTVCIPLSIILLISIIFVFLVLLFVCIQCLKCRPNNTQLHVQEAIPADDHQSSSPLYYQPQQFQINNQSNNNNELDNLPLPSVGSLVDAPLSPVDHRKSREVKESQSAEISLKLPIDTKGHRRHWSSLSAEITHLRCPPTPSILSSPFKRRMAKDLVVPEELVCPISLEVPVEPVILIGDGNIYERKVIEDWLKNSLTSPITGLELHDSSIVTSYPIRNLCYEWRKRLEKK
ncbi:hypothetical protein P9112_010935 [Eukaryota sp. TZLM1-RC]